MRKIKELVEEIGEELDGAKGYAERYVEFKAAGDSNWSGRFKQMANDELTHASYLHDLVVAEIEKYRRVMTVPDGMQEKWDTEHKKYVEKAAWVKQMLTL